MGDWRWCSNPRPGNENRGNEPSAGASYTTRRRGFSVCGVALVIRSPSSSSASRAVSGAVSEGQEPEPHGGRRSGSGGVTDPEMKGQPNLALTCLRWRMEFGVLLPVRDTCAINSRYVSVRFRLSSLWVGQFFALAARGKSPLRVGRGGFCSGSQAKKRRVLKGNTRSFDNEEPEQKPQATPARLLSRAA